MTSNNNAGDAKFGDERPCGRIGTISGTLHYSDRLMGGEGNDTLTAVGSWDALDGGAGDDVLRLSNGAEQSTTFIGGAGNDTMTGGGYNDRRC